MQEPSRSGRHETGAALEDGIVRPGPDAEPATIEEVGAIIERALVGAGREVEITA
jgi:hypothetical protein